MPYVDVAEIEQIEDRLTPLVGVLQREEIKREYHVIKNEIEQLKLLKFIINFEIKRREELLDD